MGMNPYHVTHKDRPLSGSMLPLLNGELALGCCVVGGEDHQVRSVLLEGSDLGEALQEQLVIASAGKLVARKEFFGIGQVTDQQQRWSLRATYKHGDVTSQVPRGRQHDHGSIAHQVAGLGKWSKRWIIGGLEVDMLPLCTGDDYVSAQYGFAFRVRVQHVVPGLHGPSANATAPPC